MIRSADKDRGATAITVAISMVLLMGMAAIAIDVGLGFNERRLDQTGADTGVMAGAVELVLGGSTQSTVDSVLAFVDTNIRTVLPAQWVACTDADALIVTASDLGLTPATECISFETFSKIRVRVPNQNIDTTFARVIGFSSLTTSAAAEALAIQFPGLGNPPPFAALKVPTGGEVVCLRTSAAGNPPLMMKGNGPDVDAKRGTNPIVDADPCDDSVYDVDSETFGLLDPWAYFDTDGSIACKQNVNDYFIAAGIDHPVGTYFQKYGAGYGLGNSEVQDGTGCSGPPPNSPVNGPDTMKIKTGLTAQELRCGMLTSRAGQCASVVSGPPGTSLSSPARLHQGIVQNKYKFLGEDMDNSALWEFFVEDSSGNVAFPAAPPSCDKFAKAINNGFSTAVWDYYDKRDALVTCMTDWKPSDEPLFSADVWDSSRFAFIPLLAESTLDKAAGSPIGPGPCPDSGGSCVHIDDFIPVWFQTLYTNSPNGACDDTDGGWGLHHAGQQNSCGNSNGNLVRLSSIILDCGMLPENVCLARPGKSPGGSVVPILELTR